MVSSRGFWECSPGSLELIPTFVLSGTRAATLQPSRGKPTEMGGIKPWHWPTTECEKLFFFFLNQRLSAPTMAHFLNPTPSSLQQLTHHA